MTFSALLSSLSSEWPRGLWLLEEMSAQRVTPTGIQVPFLELKQAKSSYI